MASARLAMAAYAKYNIDRVFNVYADTRHAAQLPHSARTGSGTFMR